MPSRQLSVQNQGSGWRPVYVDYNRFGSHEQVESIQAMGSAEIIKEDNIDTEEGH